MEVSKALQQEEPQHGVIDVYKVMDVYKGIRRYDCCRTWRGAAEAVQSKVKQ